MASKIACERYPSMNMTNKHDILHMGRILTRISYGVFVLQTISVADPDPHGSAFILVSWGDPDPHWEDGSGSALERRIRIRIDQKRLIRIRIRIRIEFNADPQHSADNNLYLKLSYGPVSGTCQSGWLERNSLASLLPPARIFSSSASFHLSIVTDLRNEYFNLTRLP